jgi:hypothetical protein
LKQVLSFFEVYDVCGFQQLPELDVIQSTEQWGAAKFVGQDIPCFHTGSLLNPARNCIRPGIKPDQGEHSGSLQECIADVHGLEQPGPLLRARELFTCGCQRAFDSHVALQGIQFKLAVPVKQGARMAGCS